MLLLLLLLLLLLMVMVMMVMMKRLQLCTLADCGVMLLLLLMSGVVAVNVQRCFQIWQQRQPASQSLACSLPP